MPFEYQAIPEEETESGLPLSDYFEKILYILVR
jgi:hypothetical protein